MSKLKYFAGLLLVGALCLSVAHAQTETPTPTPTPDPFRKCIKLRGRDGRYGWVFKPNGAHRRQAVLVLPYADPLGTIVGKIYLPDGTYTKRDFKEKSDGVCRAPGECLARATFAAPLSGQALRRRYGSIIIKIPKNRYGKCVYYVIPDPSKRYD